MGENYNHFVIKVITNELGFILALFVRNHEGFDAQNTPYNETDFFPTLTASDKL